MKTSAKTTLSTFLAAVLFSVTAAMTTPVFAADPASAPVAEASAPAVAAVDASAPVAADAAAPAPDAASKEVVNPYGMEALLKGGDIVAKGTLLIMAIMSMGSWYILITKIIDQVKLSAQAKESRQFWKAPSVAAGITTLKEGSPFRFIAEAAVNSTQHHEGALLEQIDLNSWVTMSIQRSVDKVQSRLQDGLAFLATVGSTAPFVGLFGTVLGIYHALTQIGASGQASIDKVAGPVGEALIMTAIGLGVAVPAVLGYNFVVRRNKSCMEEVRAFSADLHSVVLSGAMSKAAANTAKKVA
ncbi:MotA/TolQ/ExbB proton channel family protein [Undibacterium piscinae]|uniref:Biopolymer transport protein ExbB n=1 Tax=Undibacterium piscinae TaxID=2495591 RepID=A0A6M4A3L5_9BURK|nr:MotA/TolQ/ExbB proton channel family protein [Undibacterium piscinae]